jgi:hypothetical protein
VHDLAVALEEKAVGHRDAAELRHAPDVVAPEIEQHQVLGALLGSAEARRMAVLPPASRRAGGAGDRRSSRSVAHRTRISG